MKKLLGILLALALLLSCAAFAEEPAAPALQKNLVILFTSDVHCGIDQGWTYAGLYAMKESLAKDNYVLLVDDGDAIQGEPVGTMTKGEAIVDIMNAVGYDIAIPGNHEFDYGMDIFLELTKKASYPYLSCNFNKDGELIFQPWIIKEFDGVKIGFVGVTTPMTLRSSTPRYFQDEEGNFIYNFMQDENGEAVYAAVQKAVDEVRAEGAVYVVVMAHMGNEAECSPWRYDEVIANTTGIDLWLDGHSHDTEQVVTQNKDGNPVLRSGCGTKLANVGYATIGTDGSMATGLYTWAQDVSAVNLLGLENAGLEAIKAAKGALDEKLNQVVASTAVDLYINDPVAKTEDGKSIRIIRRAETNLGDLCADAYLNQSGEADIAFVNGGGIRVQLNAGDLTLNDILRVHPFGNSLTVIEITGQQVLDALEWSVHSLPGEFGGFDQVAGITFTVDPTIPTPVVETADKMFDHVDESMARRVSNVMVGGEPIDPERIYKVASHDYQLLNQGDGYTMFEGANVLQESVKLDNQVLIDYITETLGGVVSDGYDQPYGQGRITVAGE